VAKEGKNLMSMRKNSATNNAYIFRTIEELVPEKHLVRKIDKAINWDFIYDEVEDLYSDTGRKSVDPVVLFKMIFINYLFGYNSMRKTCREIEVNLAYRWFLGIDFEEKVPDYSTWSQNYIRRYRETDVFEKIFDRIIEEAYRYHFIKAETIFGDSTHQKACANKNKSIDREVEITRRVFEDELLKEINDDRTTLGKKPFDRLVSEEIDYDENGKEVLKTKTKNIKQSLTDPESGNFHKGKHEECFAYVHQTFCDKNGFVLHTSTVAGNNHDSTTFFQAYEETNEKYSGIKNVCLDSGYNTPAICKEIFENNQTPLLPYHRPMTKKGYLKKKQFTYDKENDIYICPVGVILKHTTTNRNGYKEYRSKNCEGCPLKEQCTKSDGKLITRSVWEEYREEADKIRHSELWKNTYQLRKQTIERVFADAKENYGLRFTRLRGLKKNQHQALIIFSMHNLKKLALWIEKNEEIS